MKHFFLSIIVGLLSVTFSQAQEAFRDTRLTYDEPTQNADAENTPLEDLAKTVVKIDLITDGLGRFNFDVPATALTGGGTIEQEFRIPIKRVADAKRINVQVTAVDLSGNESLPAEIEFDYTPRDLSKKPKAPTGLTVE